jgi:hypothetical protein
MYIHNWIFVFFSKYLLHVSGLTVSSSGRTLFHFSKPSAYCKLVTTVEWHRVKYIICWVVLQSCLQLLKKYCLLVMAKIFFVIWKSLETLLDTSDLSISVTAYLGRCSVLTSMPFVEVCNRPEVPHAYGSGVRNLWLAAICCPRHGLVLAAETFDMTESLSVLILAKPT